MVDHSEDVGLRSRELQLPEEDFRDLLNSSYPQNQVVY